MSPAPGAARLRVVLDTNIYISTFEFPKGRNVALWNAACEQRYRLLVSPEILRETARVLRYDFNCGRTTEFRYSFGVLADVARMGLIAPRTAVHAVLADPDDNRILECAVDGKADLIATHDHHLLDLESYAGIPIVAGVDFRRMLGLK